MFGDGPHKAHQFTGHGEHGLAGMCPACREAAKAFAQAYLRLPTDVLDRLRELFQSALQVAANFGGIPVGPGALHQDTTRMGIAGFGDRPLPPPLSTGLFYADQTEIFHQLSGVLEGCKVSEFRHGGHGHGELHATQGL